MLHFAFHIALSVAFAAVMQVSESPAPQPPMGPGQTTLHAPVTRVKMDQRLRKPVVEAMINGKGPFPFLLDTGAGPTIVNADLVEELGLTLSGTMDVGDPSDSQRIKAQGVSIGSIRIGEAEFKDVAAISWDRSPLYRGENAPRGVLGLPLFHDCLTTLEYPGSQLVLTTGHLPPADGKDVLDYESDNGIPLVPITVGDESYRAHIDSGAPSGVSLPTKEAKKLKLLTEPKVIGRGRTVNSEFEIRAAQLDGVVRIGAHEIDRPMIHFNDVLPVAILGSETLNQFVVSFDQQNQRVRFERPGSAQRSAPPDAKDQD